MSNVQMQGLGILVARGMTRRNWSIGPDNNVFVGLRTEAGLWDALGGCAGLGWGGVGRGGVRARWLRRCGSCRLCEGRVVAQERRLGLLGSRAAQELLLGEKIEAVKRPETGQEGDQSRSHGATAECASQMALVVAGRACRPCPASPGENTLQAVPISKRSKLALAAGELLAAQASGPGDTCLPDNMCACQLPSLRRPCLQKSLTCFALMYALTCQSSSAAPF